MKLYNAQNTIFGWYQAAAPDWIGVVCSGFGANAPYPNAPGSGQTKQTFTRPSPSTFSMPVLLDLHHYLRCVSNGATQFDGRNAYGSVVTDSAKDPYVIKMADGYYPDYPPLPEMTRNTCRTEYNAYAAPYAAWAGYANVPWMVGESGFAPVPKGKTSPVFQNPQEMCQDLQSALAGCSPPPVAHLQWIYDTISSSDSFGARGSTTGLGGADYAANGWQIWTNQLFDGTY